MAEQICASNRIIIDNIPCKTGSPDQQPHSLYRHTKIKAPRTGSAAPVIQIGFPRADLVLILLALKRLVLEVVARLAGDLPVPRLGIAGVLDVAELVLQVAVHVLYEKIGS